MAAETLVVVEPIGLDGVDHRLEWSIMQAMELTALMRQVREIGFAAFNLKPGPLLLPEKLDPPWPQAIAQYERYEWC